MTKPIKIYAEVLEEGVMDQFNSAVQLDCVLQAALMPDAHVGYSLPIGAVVATDNMIFPSWVGYDIGCGMSAAHLDMKRNELHDHGHKIFDKIYDRIPVGFSHHDKPRIGSERFLEMNHSSGLGLVWEDKRAGTHLGTLGGGNHFIEIGYDEWDDVWVIVHSGSRGLGHGIATHYMKLASGDGKAREGHFGFRVDSAEGEDYIADMNVCLEFALANRSAIIDNVVLAIGDVIGYSAATLDFINRNHNHAIYDHGMWIHRKGATHAEAGMDGVIPGNMRDGSFIVQGRGNPNSLWSSSHGAGRVLGRKQAKKLLNMEDFTREMQGIVAKVTSDTLDESPFAYKNIFDVMKAQEELVHIVHHITPLINIKG